MRTRAHQLWEQSGQPDGSHEDHWYQAERDIDEEDRASGQRGGEATP
ncbi:DUF2934 domain-containing protein [Mesorhizobium sp. IRAMC:0171]|uniref:DUF2934 domain-containing protein n=1 Tax=Mesorhizobium retamae TaxID=2912854 RepID=A0ABS9QLY4_9HYPH|nr:DUF2934 domain-containing protein [Mesorhizobium sp. IRAMC:0171]